MLKGKSKWAFGIVGILIGELFLLTQLKFTAWPEMILWPYLMLKEWFPYKDIAIAHNPLLLFNLSLFYKLFGVGLAQLKIFTWALILIADVITFWVVGRLWNRKTALITLLFLVPLTLFYEGNGLWFDLALVPIYILVYYFVKTKRYFWVGIFWALSFLVKQTAIFLLLPIFFEIGPKRVLKSAEQFVLGVFAVTIPFLMLLWVSKIIPDYIFWAYRFAGGKLPFSEGQVVMPTFKQLLMGFWPLIFSLLIFFARGKKELANLFLWGFFASLGVYPRWELFHFLPATSYLATAFSLLWLEREKMLRVQKAVLLTGLSVFLLLVLRTVVVSWHREPRFFEQEVIKAASMLRENVKEGDKIFVLNSWEHYYALTGTIPATRPWVPQFSWYMEMPNIQDKMLTDLITSQPEYVIAHPFASSGLDSYRPKKVADFIEKYYSPVYVFDNFQILKKR